MKFKYILELSLKNLLSRKTRSILTITGVVIGVSAITFLVSIGYGFEKMTTSQIATEEALYVFQAELGDSDLMSITDESIAKIKNLDTVEAVEPSLSMAGKANFNDIKTDIVINGYNNQYIELGNTKIFKGDYFKDEDTDKCLVSTALLKLIGKDALNFSDTEIGLEVAANNSISPKLEEGAIIELPKFKIVGIIDEQNSPFVIVPFSVLQKEISAVNYSLLKIKVKDKTEISSSRAKVEGLGFTTDYIGDTITQINAFFTIFRYIIGGFGVIAMLVAVLGMLNTLTVSLLERTKEIGVLKSNGATKKVIWRLFVSEGLIISVIGGALGIVIGMVIGEMVNIIFNIYAVKNSAEPVDFFYTPVYFVLLAMIFVTIVGFFTGLYPAGRATKIKVLDALKYE